MGQLVQFGESIFVKRETETMCSEAQLMYGTGEIAFLRLYQFVRRHAIARFTNDFWNYNTGIIAYI